MKIIALLNQKGGVGKTTLATNIAKKLHIDGHKVGIVDSDPQGSCRDWHAAGNGEIPVVGIDRPTIDKDIKKIFSDFDFCIIDGAPQLTNIAVSALKCADLVIIPVQPSPYDIWASSDLIDIVKQIQDYRYGMPKVYFLISRQITGASISDDVREALHGYDMPILNSFTCQRVAYAKSASSGGTVFESGNKEAIQEISNIVQEIKVIFYGKI